MPWTARNYAVVYSPGIPGRSAAAGEACVSALAHDTQEVVQQVYYQGTKESEKPIVRQLLNDTGLYGQKLTLDALHFNPLTVNAIHGAGGVYMIGLKSNQSHLYRHCICTGLVHKAAYERSDVVQRGHGRIDKRNYYCFTLSGSALAPRWKDAGLKTLIVVKRSRQNLAGKWLSREVSYFLSNSWPTTQADADELFDAIRHHWRIEPGRPLDLYAGNFPRFSSLPVANQSGVT